MMMETLCPPKCNRRQGFSARQGQRDWESKGGARAAAFNTVPGIKPAVATGGLLILKITEGKLRLL